MKCGKIVSMVVIVVLVVGPGLLYGCGQDDEGLIRENIVGNLEKVKGHDADFVAQVADSVDFAELRSFGIDPGEFLNVYLEGFDYRIEDVSVEGDTATVSLVIICRSFTDYRNAFSNGMTALSEDESVTNMNSDELKARIGPLMTRALTEATVVETPPIAVDYRFIDGVWTVDDKAENTIMQALLAN